MRTILTITFLLLLKIASTASSQWIQSDGPYGASVQTMFSDGSTLFAGTTVGVFRSTDSGAHWQEANQGMAKLFIKTIAAIGANLFAGTEINGLFLSTDNGSNWSVVTSFPSAGAVALVASEASLLAGNLGGVYRSTNNGADWTAVERLAGLPTQAFTTIGSRTFAAGDSVYVSTDGGSTWTQASTGLPKNPSIRSLGALGTILFAGSSGGGVFRSTNYGASWTLMNAGISASGIVSLISKGTRMFAGTFDALYVSADSGKMWTTLTSGLPPMSSILSLLTVGSNLYAGVGMKGVYVSTDNGSSWSQTSSGLRGVDAYSFAERGSYLFAGSNVEVFRSSNAGVSWVSVNTGAPTYNIRNLTVDGTNLFAGGAWGGGIWRSANDGTNWTYASGGLSNNHIMSLLTLRAGLLATVDNNQAFLSTNGGTTWSGVNSGLPPGGAARLVLAGNKLLAATNGYGVYASTNEGGSWQASNAGMANEHVTLIASDGPKLVAGNYGGDIFISADTGTSWTKTTGAPPHSFAYLTALTIRGSSIFAATDSGAFLSTDNGTSWTDVSAGLPIVGSSTYGMVNTLWISGTILYAGTSGSGIWRRPLSEMVTGVEEGISDLPSEFTLAQNYPNPFNPSTTIHYAVPRRSHVTLTVFNTLGQKVAELVNAEKGAGRYEVTFTAGRLASGVYVYRFQAGSFVRTKKLVLLR